MNLCCWIPARTSNASRCISLQYAVMGNVYSREILGCRKPRVGLLSVGTEDSKGNELTLEAFKLCKQIDINFIGNVEGYDLFTNRVDVVICDGFVGNVVLKTCESLAMGMISMLKRELSRNPKAQTGRVSGAKRPARHQAPDGPRGVWRRAAAGVERHGDEGPRIRPRACDYERHPHHHRNHSTTTSTRPSPMKSSVRPSGWAAKNPMRQPQSPHDPIAHKKFKNPRAKYDFKGRTCSISGVGSYVPERIITNADLEKMVDTTDEWITSRTGIKARRVAATDEFTSDLATHAALRAMKQAGGQARANRLDHRRHHHAGHAISIHRLSGAAEDRRVSRGGVRH